MGKEGSTKASFTEEEKRNCPMNVEVWVMDWYDSIIRKLDLRSNVDLRQYVSILKISLSWRVTSI